MKTKIIMIEELAGTARDALCRAWHAREAMKPYGENVQPLEKVQRELEKAIFAIDRVQTNARAARGAK